MKPPRMERKYLTPNLRFRLEDEDEQIFSLYEARAPGRTLASVSGRDLAEKLCTMPRVLSAADRVRQSIEGVGRLIRNLAAAHKDGNIWDRTSLDHLADLLFENADLLERSLTPTEGALA